MSVAKKQRILYFIDGPVPTAAQAVEAEKIGTKMFRNVRFLDPFGTLEMCDAVAGSAPTMYRARFPYAEVVPEPARVDTGEKPPPVSTSPAPVVSTASQPPSQPTTPPPSNAQAPNGETKGVLPPWAPKA